MDSSIVDQLCHLQGGKHPIQIVAGLERHTSHQSERKSPSAATPSPLKEAGRYARQARSALWRRGTSIIGFRPNTS